MDDLRIYSDSLTDQEILDIFNELAPADENADFDGDGIVSGLDFLIYQQNVGLTGQTDNSNGDANGDGTVGTADLAIWETQYATSPTVAAAAAVPEPSSALLLVVASLGMLRRQRLS